MGRRWRGDPVAGAQILFTTTMLQTRGSFTGMLNSQCDPWRVAAVCCLLFGLLSAVSRVLS